MSSMSLKDTAKQKLKTGVKAILSPLGLELSWKPTSRPCAHLWSEDARIAGMDVNDYIEKDHGKQPLTELEATVFPYISRNSIICELGAGTGCYSRHLIGMVPEGEYHIVDCDEHTLEFLKNYFRSSPKVKYYLNSGYSIPFEKDGWVDLGFSTSVFTGINVTYFGKYALEFFRVLKPGGYFVFDYFDASTPAGWANFMANVRARETILNYSYHTADTIDKIISTFGFDIVGRYPTVRGSTFVIARKPFI